MQLREYLPHSRLGAGLAALRAQALARPGQPGRAKTGGVAAESPTRSRPQPAPEELRQVPADELSRRNRTRHGHAIERQHIDLRGRGGVERLGAEEMAGKGERTTVRCDRWVGVRVLVKEREAERLFTARQEPGELGFLPTRPVQAVPAQVSALRIEAEIEQRLSLRGPEKPSYCLIKHREDPPARE